MTTTSTAFNIHLHDSEAPPPPIKITRHKHGPTNWLHLTVLDFEVNIFGTDDQLDQVSFPSPEPPHPES